ncbi:Asp-tRNA(Asn)/Glu-tRNA(Gln) amidotransferase subunit GatA [Corallococcus sp. AB004]|uniref:Asp-tRNA(Asn)/Glu-tRNA(Gln) amidotransferase subunit GatA n=1 Tax=Corallococcus TaxID=83461 RepID=UPI000EA3FCDC|nr:MULTISPECIES: Asp-tRNA(Asn)/Glu-tRNA(Gln) amidotransferase subunit GatA [Corallococcus]RKI37549.1 Asp-tRNA(Asn)/Glu-tRNA(Gln) amidotransferase subunit GatA [Corallococcus sp. AB004]NPC73346.1 Asp-tRNA(Asn)/Glu-tRNA(Gln) amidotransferase subunit GatA [Corallococcus exiguus]NPD24267.1 Asp-tRNA(Asn)/Glu-tRNA(Gln) amidotransferase subunit GatA [Corallococcus exiguus]NRD49442.1 Asp-tRNA(Asn)/Glu-tRNA(Gln) amidotransferase subunit GatA [Corallococcus exiguus]RKI04576.1 Asp-tRNA(Asn)/Glu-tRNA(Gln)
MSSLTDLSMLELAAKLASREVSSVEATQASLQRIAQVDPKVRAFLRVDEAGALKAAEASDARRKAGSPLSALDGVPVGLKDIFLTEGVETTCASRVLEGFVPPYDATVVRLLKEAGLPLVGKLNMDEFAMGSSNESSAYFPTHNPWDLTRTPGGSSGGSAAAVAAREVFGALGTDTGGSIRQPAALTNTVGLKPTYGRVSRYGVIAFASSLDQPGPMARTVGDTAALFQLIARHDPLDSTSADVETPDCLTGLEDGVRGLKLGVPREYFAEGMDPEVAGTLRASLEELEKLGATLVDVSLPHTKYALATYYLLASSEASSNLARYDGIRYGQRAKDARGLKELYTQTRGQGFGAEVKRRIMLGTYALSAGYYDAYYLRAQKVRTLIREDFTKVFQQVDAIVSPTSPVPAFKLGAKVDDPLSMYLMDVYTLPCNLAGLPGLSVPCGFTQGGLPIGMQLLGRPFDEARLLRIARAFEREHDFFRRAAPV